MGRLRKAVAVAALLPWASCFNACAIVRVPHGRMSVLSAAAVPRRGLTAAQAAGADKGADVTRGSATSSSTSEENAGKAALVRMRARRGPSIPPARAQSCVCIQHRVHSAMDILNLRHKLTHARLRAAAKTAKEEEARAVTDKRLLRGVLVEALEAQSRRRTALEEQLAKCTSGNYFWKVICMVTFYRKYTRVVTFEDFCQSTHRVRLGRAQRCWLTPRAMRRRPSFDPRPCNGHNKCRSYWRRLQLARRSWTRF